MGLFSSKNKKHTAALLEAVAAGNEQAVLQALRSGGDVNGRDAEGLTCLRHAIRNERLAIMALLLDSGAKPTADCAGAVAHWAERADRARRHGSANSRGALLRVRTAVRLMDQHQAPWDETIKSIGSGDSIRTAILHVIPGCLSEQGG